MLEILGMRQKELLKLLLKNKAGMTADELSMQLAITRNAVRQHLASLENDGLLKKSITRASGGRPEQLYILTDKGNECFTRHYAWFAQLLVESLQQESGAAGVEDRFIAMGTRIGTQLRTQYPELTNRSDKVKKLSEIMDQLGYNANVSNVDKPEKIEASNCVFHTLAFSNPHICKFDIALMSTFTDSSVDHEECMATGGNICAFKFKEK
ncbi:helix-turn-helix transcriptional regulator [Undibacterium sp. Di27W]|uniref:helix-turn-helix transcriptional regulator n=1 Tax=Undibacterium sp. Di27W TaxID=3413036 RepID=UPI003BF2D8FE